MDWDTTAAAELVLLLGGVLAVSLATLFVLKIVM